MHRVFPCYRFFFFCQILNAHTPPKKKVEQLHGVISSSGSIFQVADATTFLFAVALATTQSKRNHQFSIRKACQNNGSPNGTSARRDGFPRGAIAFNDTNVPRGLGGAGAGHVFLP